MVDRQSSGGDVISSAGEPARFARRRVLRSENACPGTESSSEAPCGEGRDERTAMKTVKYTEASTAFEIIADVYRVLETTEERDNWHRLSFGLEENRTAVLIQAKDFGITMRKES
jgi:hypothetical protein